MAGPARAQQSGQLSLRECRALLPDRMEIQDDDLERVRNELYALAEALIDAGRNLLPGLDERAG